MHRMKTLILFFSVLGCALPVVSLAGPFTFTSGTIRDFCADPARNGRLSACPSVIHHKDFETQVDVAGVAAGIVDPILGSNAKPVFDPAATNLLTFTTAGNFAQWWEDIPGVNQSTPFIIPLGNTGQFSPIDNALLGNQGLSHNYHFTYELHGSGITEAGEVLQFMSDDDLWVFINTHLALELAGTHNAEPGRIDLAALGLTQGEIYGIDIFFAERQTVDSVLCISSSTILGNPDACGIAGLPDPSPCKPGEPCSVPGGVEPIPEPSTLLLLATGVVGFLAIGWRRQRAVKRIAPRLRQ